MPNLDFSKLSTIHPRKNLIGRIDFGRLTPLGAFKSERSSNSIWLCLCSCGAFTLVKGTELINRHTRSCGCLRNELSSKRARGNSYGVTHGASRETVPRHPLYSTWNAMKSRCYNPRNPEYHNYGGRGITVYKKWLTDFWMFAADIGPKPTVEHQLDRYPNVNGNYEPGNIWWATRKQQGRNRTNNHLITHNGLTFCLTEWAERSGIPANLIRNRINSHWSIEQALSLPVIKGQKARAKF